MMVMFWVAEEVMVVVVPVAEQPVTVLKHVVLQVALEAGAVC